MGTRVTRWYPDTCSCIVDYEWDDTLTEESRTHTAVVAHPCAAHRSIRAVAALHAAITQENARKNTAVAAVQALGIALEDIVVVFDAARVLRLTLSKAQRGKRAAAQRAVIKAGDDTSVVVEAD